MNELKELAAVFQAFLPLIILAAIVFMFVKTIFRRKGQLKKGGARQPLEMGEYEEHDAYLPPDSYLYGMGDDD